MKGFPVQFAAPRECDHQWTPVSMRYETQLLDHRGRVSVRQPDLREGRVYFVCIGCASHTYMTTEFLGVRMYGSGDAIPEGEQGGYAVNRAAWSLPADEDDAATPEPDLTPTRNEVIADMGGLITLLFATKEELADRLLEEHAEVMRLRREAGR